LCLILLSGKTYNYNLETMEDKLCSNCGQSAKPKRIDFNYIIKEIEHVLHFEKGILFTVKELFTRPGESIREFLSNDRNRLVKPIIFIIVTSLIYSLIDHYFHIEAGYIPHENTQTAVALVFEWIQGHYGYANILMGIFIAFWMRLFFKKYGYNIFEILIVLCFLMGASMLILALFAIFEGVFKIKLLVISNLLGYIYTSIGIALFFDKFKIANYIKAFCAYTLGYLSFMLFATILGILADSL